MKVLCVTIFFFYFTFQPVLGEIKNGYEREKFQAIDELQFLEALKNGRIHYLDGTREWDRMNETQKMIVKRKIASINKTLKYYILTEQLVQKFQHICPEIYNEIYHIQDFESSPTDVYIKIVPDRHEMSVISGATILAQDPVNTHTSVSEYGKHTVQINICTSKSALKILAHEFGHVRFIIPNLSAYVEYCRIRYHKELSDSGEITFNHQASDMGSKTVFEYERKFKHAYRTYFENSSNSIFNPKKILKEMERTINLEEFYAELLPNIQ